MKDSTTTAPIAVVGGGVIGLCCAYYLRQAGREVVVLEKDHVGSGASWGNAGWIVPALSGPLPGPGQLAYAIRSVLQPDSPLYVRPRLSPALIGWMLRFARSCNRRDNLAGLHATATLAAPTMDLYDDLAADGVQFDMGSEGLLFAHRTTGGARHEIEALAPLGEHGYAIPEAPITGDALRDLEPALSEHVAAGVLVKEERHVDPGSLLAGLAARLREMGVEIREGVTVEGIEADGDRITAVRVPGGDIPVSALLLAAGAWTTALAQTLGTRLPMQAGKGYSFSLRLPTLPRRPLYLAEVSVGCTPFDGHVRVAGTMELSGVNSTLDRRRIDAIVRGARGYLEGGEWGSITDHWVGMRPVSADGLPILGALGSHSNAFVASGHAMLGVTLGPATGQAVAAYMTTGVEPEVLRPFSPSRF